MAGQPLEAQPTYGTEQGRQHRRYCIDTFLYELGPSGNPLEPQLPHGTEQGRQRRRYCIDTFTCGLGPVEHLP